MTHVSVKSMILRQGVGSEVRTSIGFPIGSQYHATYTVQRGDYTVRMCFSNAHATRNCPVGSLDSALALALSMSSHTAHPVIATVFASHQIYMAINLHHLS